MNPFNQAEFERTQRNIELGLPAGVVLSPISRRAVGQILDQLAVLLPIAVVAVVLGVRNADDLKSSGFTINVAAVSMAFLYETVMIAVWGRTLGKFAMGTRVVRIDTAGPVLWSSSSVRALIPLAAGVIPGVGFVLSVVVYATAMIDKRQQGWHDKAAGTIVVLNRPA